MAGDDEELQELEGEEFPPLEGDSEREAPPFHPAAIRFKHTSESVPTRGTVFYVYAMTVAEAICVFRAHGFREVLTVTQDTDPWPEPNIVYGRNTARV